MKKIIQKISLCVFATLAFCLPAHANLLANPGFVPAAGEGYLAYVQKDPPSWTNIFVTPPVAPIFPNGPTPNNFLTIATPEIPNPDPAAIPMIPYLGNNYFFNLGGRGNPNPDDGDGVKQTFTTIPGHRYRLTFGYNSEANGNPPPIEATDPREEGTDSLKVQVLDHTNAPLVDAVVNSLYQTNSPGYGKSPASDSEPGAWHMPWDSRTYVFTATGTSTTVEFTVNSVSENHYPSSTNPNDPNEDGVARNGANSMIISFPEVVELPPVLTVNKELGGTGRLNNNDQFVVSIKKGTVLQNPTTNSTTTGTGLTVDAGTGTTGVFTAVAATEYTIDEEMAAGSTSTKALYSATVTCTNTLGSNGTQFPANQSLPYKLTLQDSDEVTCTITNAPGTTRLTIQKVSNGGTGVFNFRGTATNANGFPTDTSYSVTTTTAGEVASGTIVNLAAINTLTQIEETLPSGWVQNTATCVDLNYANSGNPQSPFGSLVGTTLQIPASNVRAGANLQCTFTNTFTGLALSGKVILDTGKLSGIPHDALQNGGESGHSGVALSLTNCSSTVYSTTTSGADGSFSLSLNGVPPGPVCLVQVLPGGYSAVSVNAGTTAGIYTVGTTSLAFTLAANTGYSGVVLGNAPFSTFTSDGAQQAIAGQPVAYGHVYTAGSAGSVSFTTTNNPTPAGLQWSSVLYRDTNCNGTLEATDTLLISDVTVVAGEAVCILNRVSTPAGSSNGVQNVTTVKATETWSVPTLSPNSQVHELRNTDTTTVSSAGLTLLKDVRNVTLSGGCPADAAASLANNTAYAASGSAKPGDFLEYRLRYGNNTPAPLTAIKVYDVVPAYTRYVRALCLATPTNGISGCAVTQQPASGATSGPLIWTLTDAGSGAIGLQPLATGSVSFCMQVQQ